MERLPDDQILIGMIISPGTRAWYEVQAEVRGAWHAQARATVHMAFPGPDGNGGNGIDKLSSWNQGHSSKLSNCGFCIFFRSWIFLAGNKIHPQVTQQISPNNKSSKALALDSHICQPLYDSFSPFLAIKAAILSNHQFFSDFSIPAQKSAA